RAAKPNGMTEAAAECRPVSSSRICSESLQRTSGERSAGADMIWLPPDGPRGSFQIGPNKSRLGSVRAGAIRRPACAGVNLYTQLRRLSSVVALFRRPRIAVFADF